MTETLNFTIGEDFGNLLITIAQEHLLHNNDLEKAMRTIEDSLIGIDKRQAFLLLIGTNSIVVDVEKQDVVLMEGISNKKISFNKLDEEKEYIISDLEKIEENLIYVQKESKNKKISFSVKKLSKYFTNKIPDDLLKTIEGEYHTLDHVVNLCTEVIKKYREKFKMLEYLYYMAEELEVKINLSKKQITYPIEIQYLEDELLYPSFREVEEYEELNTYLDTVTKIDVIVLDGIEPVDIMDNYSAGWLSQEGVYYGLNGHIANMLHDEISIALEEKGIIPKGYDDEANGHSWLEQNGWVKQHGNWILYAGYERSELGETDVPISKTQIDILYEFGQKCHKGVLKVGLKQERISAVMFQMTDPIMFKTKWFKF